MPRKRKAVAGGFTLIELLVVIGILGILLAIVLIAINPAAQFAQANNTARSNDVNTILNAVHQFAADNKGTLPTGIPNFDATQPNNGALEISDGGANLCAQLAPDYVAALPSDPGPTYKGAQVPPGTAGTPDTCGGTYGTGYLIVKDSNGRVTVSAPGAEAVRGTTPTISITR